MPRFYVNYCQLTDAIVVLKEAKKIRFKKKSLSGTRRINPLRVSSSKISRKLLVFALTVPVICLISLTVFVALATADPAGDISSKQTQAESVRSEIATLNSQMEAKVESYNFSQYELDRIQGSIAENEATLQKTIANLAVSQSRLQKRLINMYRNGSVNVLDVLMETSDVNEFMTKFDMLTKVGEQDRDDLVQVKLLKAQVEEAQAQLATDQSRQTDLVSQLSADKADIESGLGQRQSMLTGIEGDIATLQQQEQAAQQQAAQQQAFQASVAPASDDSGFSGGGGYGPAPPSTAGGAVGIAMQYLGVPYVWGGASPSGMDCSGLVMVVYGQLGYSLPHSAAAQYSAGTPVSYDQMAPGDLVFFGSDGISHVGIYIGGGSMIHAPFEGEVVQTASVSNGGSFRGACRL